MPIQTPLVSVMNPLDSTKIAGPDTIFQSFLQGQQNSRANENLGLAQQQNSRSNRLMDIKEEEINQQKQLQQLSNIGQAAATGLDIVKRDPENAETALREYIEKRKSILPAMGFTNMEDTNDLEKALNEGGVPEAVQVMSSALDVAKSGGFKLPPPTTPDVEGTFTGIGKSGKPEIFFRTDQGAVPTNILAPEKTPLVSVNSGGGNKEKIAKFGELFDESKNVDRTLSQFSQVKNIVREGGLGSIGTSGKVTKGFEKAASALGGLAKNMGIVDDFDEGSILSGALKGTPLGDQANRNAKVSSLITNLGFAVAQAQNPGGRITDKDFEAAVRTIGASADNPEQLIDVIDQFGENLLTQFDTDVDRTGNAFGFSKQQFKDLRNIPSRKGFLEKPEKTTSATSTIQEGQTATNPKTGEKMVYKNGKWVKQ